MQFGKVVLQGQMTLLEPIEIAHAAELVAATADGSLWTNRLATIPSEQNVTAYIETALALRNAETAIPFVIRHRRMHRIIGSTRFFDIDARNRRLEIGYTWMGASHQGTSVNPEIKYLMLRYAFEELHCLRVQFRTDALNEQSQRALARLGAVREGVLRKERVMPDGRVRDAVVFSILDSEWAAVRENLEQRLRALGITPSYSFSAS